MPRIASWIALLLGSLILVIFVPLLVETVLLGQKFGTSLTMIILSANLHILAGVAVGLALVVTGAWGFARGRHDG